MTWRLDYDSTGGPVLVTARLRLRVPQARDLAPLTAFWSSERSRLMAGPQSPAMTRESFDDLMDQWRRFGFGLFHVTHADSDAAVGAIGPWFPASHPEPELGWSLWRAEDEGRGLAFEAAVAARDWFFAATHWPTAVSHTDPDNHRSHRLCERLGAVVDPLARHSYGDQPTRTYRHVAPRRAAA